MSSLAQIYTSLPRFSPRSRPYTATPSTHSPPSNPNSNGNSSAHTGTYRNDYPRRGQSVLGVSGVSPSSSSTRVRETSSSTTTLPQRTMTSNPGAYSSSSASSLFSSSPTPSSYAPLPLVSPSTGGMGVSNGSREWSSPSSASTTKAQPTTFRSHTSLGETSLSSSSPSSSSGSASKHVYSYSRSGSRGTSRLSYSLEGLPSTSTLTMTTSTRRRHDLEGGNPPSQPPTPSSFSSTSGSTTVTNSSYGSRVDRSNVLMEPVSPLPLDNFSVYSPSSAVSRTPSDVEYSYSPSSTTSSPQAPLFSVRRKSPADSPVNRYSNADLEKFSLSGTSRELFPSTPRKDENIRVPSSLMHRSATEPEISSLRVTPLRTSLAQAYDQSHVVSARAHTPSERFYGTAEEMAPRPKTAVPTSSPSERKNTQGTRPSARHHAPSSRYLLESLQAQKIENRVHRSHLSEQSSPSSEVNDPNNFSRTYHAMLDSTEKFSIRENDSPSVASVRDLFNANQSLNQSHTGVGISSSLRDQSARSTPIQGLSTPREKVAESAFVLERNISFRPNALPRGTLSISPAGERAEEHWPLLCNVCPDKLVVSVEDKTVQREVDAYFIVNHNHSDAVLANMFDTMKRNGTSSRKVIALHLKQGYCLYILPHDAFQMENWTRRPGSGSQSSPGGDSQCFLGALVRLPLLLVWDLDNTLVDCLEAPDSRPSTLSSLMRSAKSKSGDVQSVQVRDDVGHYNYTVLCKLRPGAIETLHSLASKYEMIICTMGMRSYAKAVVKAALDPEGKLFSRIVAREDLDPHPSMYGMFVKDLPKLCQLGIDADPRRTVVVDDSPDVWKQEENVLPVMRYLHFSHPDSCANGYSTSLAAARVQLEQLERRFRDASEPWSLNVPSLLREIRR